MIPRKIHGLTAALVMTLIQGCGGGGGGSTKVRFSPPLGLSIEKKDSHSHSESESMYRGTEPSSISHSDFVARKPYDVSKLSKIKKGMLSSAYDKAIKAYKDHAGKNSPMLGHLVAARFLSVQNHTALPKGSKISLDDSNYMVMMRVLGEVEDLCRKGQVGSVLGDPDFIKNQSYLTKTADQHWKTHTKSISQIWRMNNLLKQGVELGDDAPMVADISNSQGLFNGLEDDHWYAYGQAYVFRGHWEPEAGLKQEYKGEGAEFGTFRYMGNGLLLGGMFGLQKVRMEANAGISGNMESDAQIYRLGPFVSWNNDRWTVDSMLTYGWVSLDTDRRDLLSNRWKASPKGSEWAAHLQTSYRIPLDEWTMGLSLIPEAYVGYRLGTIEKYTEKSENLRNPVTDSKHKGLTTRLGTGIGYMLPDLSQPTDIMVKLGVQKTHGWEDKEKSSSSMWAKTPKAENRDTAMYYSLAVNRQFGADLDKIIGLEYAGTSGKKSGSDALIFSYRQTF
ncbi:autotransporter outer membrane beta-barrel domain-containing protein [Endozoicomonas gorgoniicola]|uniref:Autotransporter outer membrane beta-barrel domain-containing protein n=1 Tax=Endozoicomonas gorgoniicola TaxID=1234144 RepID=A0ABT3N303_9GAMM|nr:autotransporter outer membrane beta-barrel domain-containing protein [Endozoicomonas gorgoniicola]MCW7556007.1 autotransporter outer membrane beta-barrel domain-containing protein [Endozoicomonas gorgoniicola]